MIRNTKLLIDAECPLCQVYGKGFVKLGMLESESISPYQLAKKPLTEQIDMSRAKNEIALHDYQSSRTYYGIDALIKIVSQENRIIYNVLHFAPVHIVLRKLYRFISFNRKVIAPASAKAYAMDCNPSFHIGYRWAYIIFSAIFTGFILTLIARPISVYFGLGYSPYFEFAMCFGQTIWQSAVLTVIAPKKIMHYLGHMSTISTGGALLLIPAWIIFGILGLSPLYLLISFGLVVGVMIREHIKRCKTLELPVSITLSWLGYRFFVLMVFILIFY